MSNSPENALKTMLANIPEKTGKPLDEWLGIIGKLGLSKHGQIVSYLKTEHGVTHGFANLLANRAKGGGEIDGDGLIDAQYVGDKMHLRPIYDALISIVNEFGSDVVLSPKKTYMSIRRSKQFAIIQPSTKTCIDLGINLKGIPASGKLELSGSFNAMVSHRVRLSSVEDVNQEVKSWLLRSFEVS